MKKIHPLTLPFRWLLRFLFHWVPLRLVLPCPKCATLHIDRGEWAWRFHSRHLCASCGHVWEPWGEESFGVPAPDPAEHCE